MHVLTSLLLFTSIGEWIGDRSGWEILAAVFAAILTICTAIETIAKVEGPVTRIYKGVRDNLICPLYARLLPAAGDRLLNSRMDGVVGLLEEIKTSAQERNTKLDELGGQIGEIHHEVHFNNGSSIKDSTFRIEAALYGVLADVKFLFDLFPVGIFQLSADKDCTFVTELCAEICGTDVESLIGKRWTALIHPSDRLRVTEDWLTAFESELPNFYSRHRMLNRHTGEIRHVEVEATLRRIEGKFAGYAGTVRLLKTEQSDIHSTH